MAKLTGLLLLEGTLGGMSFYKTKHGYFVRQKGGVSKQKIKSSPAFARTRENIAEFSHAGQAIRLFRQVFKSALSLASDSRVTGRLMAAMMKVVQSDVIHRHGQRSVMDGDPQVLEGFDFNVAAPLNDTLLAPIRASIARQKGRMVVDIPALKPPLLIKAPQEATHYRFFATGAAIDFDSNTYDTSTAQSEYLPANVEQTNPVQLVMEVQPRSEGLLFVLLGIEFVEIINGVPAAIRNKSANAMAVVRAA